MAFDNADDELHPTPMEIADNHLFTAREKLNLLHQLKADASGAEAEGRVFSFASGEIEEAIAHVHSDVQEGVGTTTAFKGDY